MTEKTYCPGCKNHCPKGNTKCNKGAMYFAKLKLMEKVKQETQKNSQTDDFNEIYELLKECKHCFSEVKHDIDKEKIFNKITVDEKEFLKSILTKLSK